MSKPLLRFLAAIAFAGAGIHNAYALPVGNDFLADLASETSPSIDTALQGTVDFTAIVALSNCSGSLVRFETSLSTDRAMVLTNGHCLGGGFLKPGEAKVNAPVSRSFRLLNRDASKTLATLNADRILYATMTHTDVALYGLTETYDEIERKYGTRALTMSSRHPEQGRTIAVASGYWKKIYRCSIDRFIPELREADWIFRDSIRYTQPGCHTIGGTSGSPIIDAETYEVIGINNTGNEDGQRCTMNNPCEVDENGNVTVVANSSYGQETYWFYSCLDSRNQFDLNLSGCVLTKPAGN